MDRALSIVQRLNDNELEVAMVNIYTDLLEEEARLTVKERGRTANSDRFC